MERHELKKRILDELDYLQDLRRPTEEDRGIAASLVYPRRKQFEGHAISKLFTSKGRQALNTAVLGIMGNMISSSVDWFDIELDTDEDQDQVTGLKDWLELTKNKMMKEFEQFKLYQRELVALRDACAQGTSAMMILDDVGKDQVSYKVFEPEEFYIKENDDEQVERFYREYTLTAMDALDIFGEENCPKIRDKYESDPYGEHDFIHAIFPRKDRDPFDVKDENKKYASIYYSYTEDDIVKESGFDYFPVVVHRWIKDTTSPYGGCPTFDCIETLKVYNKAWNNKLKQDAMLTDPAIMAPKSLRGRFSNVPGAVNYVDMVNGEKIQPVYNGSNYQVMKDSLEMLLQEIDGAFHTDYFRMLVNREKQMTAREVIEVLGERASILVPVVERIQSEVITPIVTQHFEIMKKAGRLPELPMGLTKKKDLKISVSIKGPLSQAMKNYHQAGGVNRALEITAPILQLFPGSEDNVDSDELIRIAMDTSGMPQKVIREIAQRKKVREAKLKQMEAQAAQQQQLAEAEVYNKTKDTPGQGSPMQQFIQGSQQAASGAMR